MTRSYLFLGDTHGDLDFAENAAALAVEYDAEIIQVGDWGFLWPAGPYTRQPQTDAQLDALNLGLKRAGELAAKGEYAVHMRFVDGNHDWHPELRKRMGADWEQFGCGVTLRSNVTYQPRGSTYTDDEGTRFLFLGGAPSIDKAFRTPGTSWWPEEVISDEEFERAMAVEGPVHVVVTHDAPFYPVGFAPKGAPKFREQSARSFDMVRQVIEKHEPDLLVHGHWHHRYQGEHGRTRIVGLDCNHAPMSAAAMLWSRW